MEVLPLLELFTQLREAGLPLGIGEYQLVLKAWQAGYGTKDRAALARLCRTLWVKSPEEDRIFAIQFDRLMQDLPPNQIGGSLQTFNPRQLGTPQNIALAILVTSSLIIGGCWWLLREKAAESSSLAGSLSLVKNSSVTFYEASLPLIQRAPDEPDNDSGNEVETDSPEEIADEVEVRLDEQEAIIIDIPTQVLLPQPWWKQYGLMLWVSLWLASGLTWGWLQWRAFRQKQHPDRPNTSLALTQQMQDEVQVAHLSQVITSGDYLPVTRRQMKQSWRHLRRMVREGPPTELDMDATVQDIGRRGVLLAPILRARRVNRAEVLLLVDQDGSMVPFHGLSQRLVETVLQGGRLTRASVYYFHNAPVTWLYHDPSQQTATAIEPVLQSLTSDCAGALIISDGGAAYGRRNPHRLILTQQFLAQLSQRVRYIAWLNPMPHDRWADSTAADIAQQIPMFEFDRTGLEAAIDVLRGQRQHRA